MEVIVKLEDDDDTYICPVEDNEEESPSSTIMLCNSTHVIDKTTEAGVVKMENDEEEHPCTYMCPVKEEEDKPSANMWCISTQVQDNSSLEFNASKNDKVEQKVTTKKIGENKVMWRRRSTRVNEKFSKWLRLGGRKLEHCRFKKIGLDLDVGSGQKQKLNLQLLTNGVMLEISELSKALSAKDQIYYITEILEYNFDIVLHNEAQRQEFKWHTWNRVVKILRQPKRKLDEAFTLHIPWMLNMSTHSLSPDTFIPSTTDHLRRSGICSESDDLGYAKNFVDIKPELNSSPLDIKTETTYTESEETWKDLYPLCQEIGLDLDVTCRPKGWAKEKLDMGLLTRRVMIEVARYAKEVCGTYKQILLDIVDHNFDIDLQTVDSELSRNIFVNFGELKRATQQGRPRLKRLGWLERPFSMRTSGKRPPSSKSVVSENHRLKEAVAERQLKLQIKRQLTTSDSGRVSTDALPLTPSNETHTTFCCEEVRLEPDGNSENADLPAAPKRRKRADNYALCEELGIDLNVQSKSESKEKKVDQQLLTRAVMYEIHKYVKKNKRGMAYGWFLYDILNYNFDISIHSQHCRVFVANTEGRVKRMVTRYKRGGVLTTNTALAAHVFKLSTQMQVKKIRTVPPPSRKSERICKKRNSHV